MSPRTYRRLSFKDKYKLVEEVKLGSSKQSILNKYGICERTYNRVLASESYLMSMAQNYEFAKKKCFKTSENADLDAAVFKWFQETKERGDPISGPILKEKALQLNANLNGPQTFKASEGWLCRFKKRHGIQSVRLNGKKLSKDSSSAAESSITTSSEAFDCLLKFENWLSSRVECLPKHLYYIKELENLIIESSTSQISENKTYLRL